MKVALINSYFDYGSTGKIEKEIVDYLISKKDIPYVYYAWETNFRKDENVTYFKYATTIEKYITALAIRITGNRYGYAYFSTLRLIKRINKDKPDVVHIHCPNSFDLNIKKIIKYLKNSKIKTVITEHAEFYHTGNCPHSFECDKWRSGCGNCPNLFFSTKSKLVDRSNKNWKEMKEAFKDFDKCTLVPVSDWLKDRTEKSPITKELKIKRIHNGIDTDLFRYHSENEITKEIKDLFNKKTVLFITSNLNSELKGFKYFLEVAKKMKDINFLLICNERCNLDGYENIKHIEYISDKKELAQYYSMADVSLICSKRETFSMIVAESLCCGTPVAGFKAGGPESIAIKEYSLFCDYGDIETMVENVNLLMGKNHNKECISKKAIDTYSSNLMCSEYYNIYIENDNNLKYDKKY